MFMLDGTGVSVALPHIQRAFALPQGQLQWVMTGLSLALAASVATGGRLGDLVGRVPVFVAGVVLFATGSILCAAAPGLSVLVAGRIVEGIAAGLMTPAAAVLACHEVRQADDAETRQCHVAQRFTAGGGNCRLDAQDIASCIA